MKKNIMYENEKSIMTWFNIKQQKALLIFLLGCLACLQRAAAADSSIDGAQDKRIKMFILAGDENVLGQGVISAQSKEERVGTGMNGFTTMPSPSF